ncbi:MAG: histidine kinase [Flavobacteriaceae bacterium]|nr:histidine kinase [Flavobacteriaceae bacterium]
MDFNLDKLIKGWVIIGPYFLFLTLFLHIYHAYQINKNEKLALKNKNISTTIKHQQLKNQINPHFLFNNISVLTSLIEENPIKAIHFSESLASIYQYILKQDKHDTIPLKQDLGFINQYITLLKYRFENAINFHTKIEYSNKYHLPTMALQQVIENVVKHNQISSEKPITISITTEDNYLVISNNCNSKNKGNYLEKTGIKNLTERYSYLTDSKIDITHTLTEYRIKLPLLTLAV